MVFALKSGWDRLPGSVRRVGEALLAAAFFFGFATYFTWPLLPSLSFSIYGAHGDATGGIAYYRELIESGLSPVSPGLITDWAVPFGRPVQWVTGLAGAGAGVTLWLLSLAAGPIAAYGIYTLAGYTLSGVAMYGLTRWLGATPIAGLVAGWAYAFYPLALLKGMGHNDFVQGWVLVALIWTLLWLIKAPSIARGVAAGVVAALAMTFNGYFILFGGVVLLVLAGWGIVQGLRTGRPSRVAAVYGPMLLIPLIVLGALRVLAGMAGGGSERLHDFAQIQTYTARPWEYVLPATRNPLVGDAATRWLVANSHGSSLAENRIYVGLSVLVIAAVGAWVSWRRPALLSPFTAEAGRVVSLLVIAAFLLSLPPRLPLPGGAAIPMPSSWMYALSPTWRVYSRLVMVVMAGLALLVTLGMTRMLSGVRSRNLSMGASLLILATVMFDLWAPWPQPRVTDVSWIPPIVEQVGRAPDGRVAFFPLTPAAESLSYELYYQDATNKPMINGYLEGSEAERIALLLGDLYARGTVNGLQALGVRYVVLRTAGTPLEGRALRPPPVGLRQMGRDIWGVLYEVPPNPRAALAAPVAGFSGPEPSPGGTAWWMERDRAAFRVLAPCKTTCSVEVSLSLSGYMHPRRVTLESDVSSKVITVPAGPASTSTGICVPVKGGMGLLVAAASPGPQQIIGPDPRSVSVQVQNLTAAVSTKCRAVGR